MTMTKHCALMLAVIIGLLTTGASATWTQSREMLREEFSQTYPLAAGGRVGLENINGAVRISAWDRNEVKVDAVKMSYTAERLKEAEIIVNATTDAIHIKTKYPTDSLSWSRDEPRRYNNPASVEYTLTVPRNARLDDIELINGALDIEGLAGEVKASSINGRLTARALTGETKLSVINGQLEATFDRLDESKSISLGSVNGSLILVLPSDSNAEVKASTVHGGIKNDFNLPVRRGEYVGHNLAGVIGRGGARIRLQNVNGSITLRRAEDGRPLSNSTSLLSGAQRDSDHDDNGDGDMAREQMREQREAQREAERERRQAQREAERERRDALREAAQARREVERGQLEARREVEQAQREAQREVEQARRETEIEAREIAREAQQMAEEAQREALNVIGEDSAVWYEGTPRIVARESKTFAVGGASRVRVETFDGPITVRAWDKAEVSVNAIKRATDAREMSGIKLRAEQRGDAITVAAEFDKAFSRPVNAGTGAAVYNSAASVEYEVFVPRGATLSVSTSDGRLLIEGVRGDVELRTSDGSIDVSGGSGSLRAQTSDGRIRIVDFDGAVDARTSDGRITLDGRFTQLAARTGDGTISLALPAGFDAIIETTAESVVNNDFAVAIDDGGASRRVKRWKVGQGGKVFTLETGDGRVILRPR